MTFLMQTLLCGAVIYLCLRLAQDNCRQRHDVLVGWRSLGTAPIADLVNGDRSDETIETIIRTISPPTPMPEDDDDEENDA